MKKRIAAIFGIVTMVLASGCSSDTKESIQNDAKQLIEDCMKGKYDMKECEKRGKEIEARAQAWDEKHKKQ